MAKSGKKCSALRDSYPDYFISKNKIEFAQGLNIDNVLGKIINRYHDREVITIDGVRINFGKEWVHLRKSNTEPVIRIYAESDMPEKADNLARKILNDFREILNDQ